MERPAFNQQISARLLGKTRSAILGLLLSRPEQEFYQQEITQAVGARVSAVQRELRNLQAVGLVESRRRGNRLYYQANQQSPLFPELHGLMLKTSGLADVVQALLEPLADRISVAFVYGSVAAGTARAESDIDLCLIGELTLGDLAPRLAEARAVLGREVNPVTFQPEEWRRSLKQGDHFATTISAEPKIFLIGGEYDLGRLGGTTETPRS